MDIEQKFLTNLIEQKKRVSVYLKAGIRLEGYVFNFDMYSILLSNDPLIHWKEQLILKHTITTIISLF